ncbi:hypothetical protein LTR40_007991, partial [Exophiala xenobiotica]
ELRENAQKLHFLPHWFVDKLLNEQELNAMINSIMAGMRQRVLDYLNRSGDNFTIEQLMSVLEPVEWNDNRAGVYTRIYYKFKHSNRLPSQYTGKTNNLASRDSGHEGSKEVETHSNHYSTRRAATKYIMAPICLLNEENLRTVAEQFFTCLFETYTQKVLDFEDRSGKSQDENIGDIERYYNDKEASVCLMKLARSAFEKSGWPGCRSRQSYGASDGCNWNSPITEWLKGERIIWTKLDMPESNIFIFQRTPVQVRSGSGGNRRIYITMEQPDDASTGWSRGSFEPSIPEGVDLPLGTWVWPVIEMTRDGTQHPRSYARLPTVGPWLDWDAANSWAVRIEFRGPKSGNWESLELVSARPLNSRAAQVTAPGAFNSYAQGVAINRFLNQGRLSRQGRPPWMYYYGVARLKEQKLDWLSQTGTIMDIWLISTLSQQLE